MADDLPIKVFASQETWERWLERNHAKAEGIWLKLAKKASRKRTVSYPEAVEVALCYGWIDGQTRGSTTITTSSFTPRRARSNWSKSNLGQGRRAHRAGQDAPPGLAEVERAKADGRRCREPSSPRTLARRLRGNWHPGAMPELAIRLRGAVKRYGQITAVDGLDLDVPMGTCVGLLGPNGAGKSTTMRLLTAQSIADEGEIEVLGFKLPGESKQARAQLGVAPQLDNLDTTLTVEQNLLVFSHLYRIDRCDRRGDRTRPRDVSSSNGAATVSTSSPAACAGGCSSPGRSSTGRGSF